MAAEALGSSGKSESGKRSSEKSPPYYLGKTILNSSVIFQVVRGNLRFPSSNDVVFGKETSIELVFISEDGTVHSVCDQRVFGNIKAISILPARIPEFIGRDLLVVISASGDLSFLAFCTKRHRFVALEHVKLSGRKYNFDAGTLAVDTNGCFIVVGLFFDKLALLSLSESPGTGGMVETMIFWPLDFGTIQSMSFISQPIHNESGPLLAILVNKRSQSKLLLVEWNIKDKSACVLSKFHVEGPMAQYIVEVPNSFRYAFLFRNDDIMLMDFYNKGGPILVYKTSLDVSSSVEGESNEIIDIYHEEGIDIVAPSTLLQFMCWSWEPRTVTNPRLIFRACSGDLYMVQVFYGSNGAKFDISESLYKHSPFKALMWVEGGLLAAIANMGDGMVLKLEAGCLSYRSPIQSTAPILDMQVIDYPDDKRGQMYACCGMAIEGSVRMIRSGSSVDKLFTTPANYEGITGTWALKLKSTDAVHSFIVISFSEETRVLSVGLSYSDVTDSAGFQADVCTLACGLVADGLLVQIHKSAVRIFMTVNTDGSEAIPSKAPHCLSWSPGSTNISLGAVAKDLIVVATSSPCCLFILGVSEANQIIEWKKVRQQDELPCISITRSSFENECSTRLASVGRSNDYLIIIGTHKPSVEVYSFSPDTGHQVVASGSTFIASTEIYGFTPQDVQLILGGHPYILVGLRNGMLLKLEWPASSAVSPCSSVLNPAAIGVNICLPCGESSATQMSDSLITKHTIPEDLRVSFSCSIGINPVSLIPMSDCSAADIIALSDRPWLLHTARQPLSYTPISSELATYATPVCSGECPKGILFVAENRLHLVEMDPCKTLNFQKICIEGTPRKILYHSDSKLLLLLRTDLLNGSSDICSVDPTSRSVFSTFTFKAGETGRCMDLVKVGNDSLLVVGTEVTPISTRAPCTRGRLLVLFLEHTQSIDGSRDVKECKALHLRLAHSRDMPAIVRAVCPYLDRYFLASAGNAFYVFSFQKDTAQRVKQWARTGTTCTIMTLTTYNKIIAVGDSSQGVYFYSYDNKNLKKLYRDPVQRHVADCILMDAETAVVSDRRGGIAVLSSAEFPDDEELYLSTSEYYAGEVARCMWKGAFCYRDPAAHALNDESTLHDNDLQQNCIMVSTLLGSIRSFLPLQRGEYELLKGVQAQLAVHPLTAPILGNSFQKYRTRDAIIPKILHMHRSCIGSMERILDGDMLTEFLKLTKQQREEVLDLPFSRGANEELRRRADQVVRLLERILSASY